MRTCNPNMGKQNRRVSELGSQPNSFGELPASGSPYLSLTEKQTVDDTRTHGILKSKSYEESYRGESKEDSKVNPAEHHRAPWSVSLLQVPFSKENVCDFFNILASL